VSNVAGWPSRGSLWMKPRASGAVLQSASSSAPSSVMRPEARTAVNVGGAVVSRICCAATGSAVTPSMNRTHQTRRSTVVTKTRSPRTVKGLERCDRLSGPFRTKPPQASHRKAFLPQLVEERVCDRRDDQCQHEHQRLASDDDISDRVVRGRSDAV